MTSTIILTIHNKGFLLPKTLTAIRDLTVWNKTDIVFVLDGCTDNSEDLVKSFCGETPFIKTSIVFMDNVYETKSNNAGAKRSNADYLIFLQDDVLIKEYGWNERLLMPFINFDDVYAVSGNCAHNWEYNVNTQGVNADGWGDIMNHRDHAKNNNTPRNIFAIRDSVNRAPLAIDRIIFNMIGGFDEDAIDKQDMDDADFNYRVHKSFPKYACGFFGIDFICESNWGGTRDAKGRTKQWSLDCQKKNSEMVYQRHKDIIHDHRKEDRICE